VCFKSAYAASVLESDTKDGELRAVLGRDSYGEALYIDIAKAPHIQLAGTTGSGKSVLVNSLLVSLLMRYTPKRLHLYTVDVKRTELPIFNNCPHTQKPCITDPKAAAKLFEDLAKVMDDRYKEMEAKGLKKYPDHEPSILVVVDEYCDLVMSAPEVENPLIRIAQLGRAAKLHLIIATQRPTKTVLNGIVQANLPTKLALRCNDVVESRICTGRNKDICNASRLLGAGDGFYVAEGEPVRFQTPWVSPQVIQTVTEFWSNQK
jgi:S-DNA-T family DNA segregation ATPase FtsK/SpoIIIE